MSIFRVLISFLAGLLSFASPCVLPLLPSFFSFISGISYDKLNNSRNKLFIPSLFFTLGFSSVFTVLGIVASSILSSADIKILNYFRFTGGILVILFGLNFIFNFIPFLNKEFKINLKSKNFGYLSPFLIGATFSLGWTPCIGPQLSSIFFLASSDKINAFIYLLAYSLGFSLPFWLLSLFYSFFMNKLNFIKKHMKSIKIISGIILILLGFTIIFNKLSVLDSLFSCFAYDNEIFYKNHNLLAQNISHLFFAILLLIPLLFFIISLKKSKQVKKQHLLHALLFIGFASLFVLSLLNKINLFLLLNMYFSYTGI